jgi:hypothetical protein
VSGFASSFPLSRVTLFSFLLALMLAAGIRLSTLGLQDGCSAYLAGNKGAPAAEYVVTGTRTVVVPCDQWLPRQPTWVQLSCLLELVLIVTFVLNGLGNAYDWYGRRRSR